MVGSGLTGSKRGYEKCMLVWMAQVSTLAEVMVVMLGFKDEKKFQ
jgi:hypothetical protein